VDLTGDTTTTTTNAAADAVASSTTIAVSSNAWQDNNNYDALEGAVDASLPSTKKQLVREDLAPKRISHIQFGLLSADEMQRVAEFRVTSRELFTIGGRSRGGSNNNNGGPNIPSQQQQQSIVPLSAPSSSSSPGAGPDETGQQQATPQSSASPLPLVASTAAAGTGGIVGGGRIPARGGCLDPRLGVSDKVSTCETCKLKLVDCAGHYGYIQLALPVFHIGFFRHTLHVLQCICKTCSRVLLAEEDRARHLERMRHPKTDALAKATLFKKLVDKCKKAKTCPYCLSLNGTVKKVSGVPTLKIVHERFKGRKAAVEDEYEDFKNQFGLAIRHNKDLEVLVEGIASSSAQANTLGSSASEDLLPTRVLELFSHITDSDCEVLWIDPLIGRPENLILQNLLVPPVPIRPSVAMDVGGGSNEDDLTVKLQEIIDVNVALELALSKGPATRTIIEEWDFLQVQVAQYINGEMPGMQRPMGGGGGGGGLGGGGGSGGANKPSMRGLCQRLKGKQGRFRGNLSGKRVDFSARTVISPDPNLRVDQVGVPLRVAMTMTYPERVSRYNIDKLRARVKNGPEKHPGANFIRMRDCSFVRSLAFGDREISARSLRYGDIVERHMEDDDIVLFNRQPSLHKVSIMAHRVKVMDWKTFRFNTCVCAPYNADFDGDEMNMHLPQTEEARTEAALLMGVKQNLVTPRNGEPLVAASQDFLSAAYLLTQRDQFFNRERFCQLVSYFGDAEEHIDLPQPAILKPVELWTGKQVFSMLLVPNKSSDLIVNFESKEKNYTSNKHFCRNDGWVSFRNSEIMSGNIAKKTIGDGSKTGLLYVLLRDCGSSAAAHSMDRWAKFSARYLGGHRGLSIGISDVTPSNRLRDIKNEILLEGYRKVSLPDVHPVTRCGNPVLSMTLV